MTIKTVCKLTSAVLFLAILPGTARAQTNRVVENGVVYSYVSNTGEWVVSGIDYETLPYNGVITIKSSVSVEVFPGEPPVKYPVTSIVDDAFKDEEVLKGVNFEEGIKSIGTNALKGCTGITTLTLPSTIVNVGEGAFACGDNLRWIDARNVGEDWKEELVYGNYILKTPGDMGVPLFTLLYMPTWWTANDKNIVVTDATTQERSCSKFYFSSEMDYNVPWGFTAEQVINTRTLPMDDGAYTICLPYDLGIPDNAKVYVLMETDVPEGDRVVFTQVVGTLDKGMPYLVKADGDVSLNSEIPSQILSTEEAQTSSMTVAGITINGTFSNITHADAANMGAYVLQAENRWVSVSKRSEAVYVPPYRAYITMEGFMANGFSISFSDSIDDIRLLPDGTAVIDGGTWYTLQGVQLPSQPHTPGVYVHQGRKYVVK